MISRLRRQQDGKICLLKQQVGKMCLSRQTGKKREARQHLQMLFCLLNFVRHTEELPAADFRVIIPIKQNESDYAVSSDCQEK